MALFGGGNDLITGREAQLPEWLSPMVGGAGPYFGDANQQMPYMDLNSIAPYFDYQGPFGQTQVVPETQHGGRIPFSQFAGPSGQVGLLPNLSFLYGQEAERIREGTSPLLQPAVSGLEPMQAQASQWMADAVPALTPFTTDALFGIRRLLQGDANLPGQGTVNYFAGLPEPTYARGLNPMYTAGLGALGGAGRMFPTMLDPLTEGARRSALSGTVPVGTYQPLLQDIERRGAEQQSDLTRAFAEDVAPGLVQQLATGRANYGSAGERMAGRMAREYGEQQRRIAEDTRGQIGRLYSGAAQDALQRQYGAMGLGAQAAQNIFGQGANILGQQTGLEQSTMGSAMDRALQAAQMGMGSGLNAMQIGLGALPSIGQAALDPLQQFYNMGMMNRQVRQELIADQIRRDPLNASWQNLQRFGGMIGATPMPGSVQESTSGTDTLGSLGGILSGLGALAGAF